jgi:hypothetical protein
VVTASVFRRFWVYVIVNYRRVVKSVIKWIGRDEKLAFVELIVVGIIFAHCLGLERIIWFSIGVVVTLFVVIIVKKAK